MLRTQMLQSGLPSHLFITLFIKAHEKRIAAEFIVLVQLQQLLRSVRLITYIHTYSFITQNDRTHLHKIKIQVKKTTNKSSRVKTAIKQLIRVFEQHVVNKIPFAQLTGDNT